MKKFVIAALLSLTLAGSALAEAQCASHEEVANILLKEYGETVSFMGIAQDGNLMEMYTSEKGTWTLTVTLPSGLTCLVAGGEQFQTLPQGEPA